MGRLGFEPRTNRLKAECSTAELATRNLSEEILTKQRLAIVAHRLWLMTLMARKSSL
jgi:hypothetical protein